MAEAFPELENLTLSNTEPVGDIDEEVKLKAEKKWFEKKRNETGSKSSYYLGDFLRMDNDQAKKKIRGIEHSPDYSCYKVKPGGEEELENTHKKYAKFEISNLVHNTSLDNYVNILNECVIKQRQETELGDLGSHKLSWWGLSFDVTKEATTQKYWSEMERQIYKWGTPTGTRGEEYQTIQLLKSAPFFQTSRYGNYRISLSLASLRKFYEDSLVYEDSIEKKSVMKILWTDVYDCEVMHTVLIHPQKMSAEFKDLQTMDEYLSDALYPVIEKNEQGDQWIWRPQSTSVVHPDSVEGGHTKYKHWEHVTFAFLIPDGCNGINVPYEDLISQFTIHNISGKTNLTPDKKNRNSVEAKRVLREKAKEKLSEDKFKKLEERIRKIQRSQYRFDPGDLFR